MKRKILFALIILFALQCTAQQLPSWVNNKPTPTNDTYLYVVESGIGQTELEARNLAIAEVFRTTAMRIEQRFDSEEISRALQRGEEYSTISTTYAIPINKVCEYPEKQNNGFKVYVLCQVARTGEISPVFDDFNDCYPKENMDVFLYVDGWDIYYNGRPLDHSEISRLFTDSKTAVLYEKGLEMETGIDDPYLTPIVLGPIIELVWFTVGVNKVGSQSWDDFVGYYKETKFVVYGGIALTLSGFVLPYAKSFAMNSIGKAKIRKAVNLYNKSRKYALNDLEVKYGLTGNGVFLSFSF